MACTAYSVLRLEYLLAFCQGLCLSIHRLESTIVQRLLQRKWLVARRQGPRRWMCDRSWRCAVFLILSNSQKRKKKETQGPSKPGSLHPCSTQTFEQGKPLSRDRVAHPRLVT